ncbi:MAG: branched-chain amino acid ABC transporter permease, partial [Planctomycetota bacterium]
AAAIVSFPLLSIQWDQEKERAQGLDPGSLGTVTPKALWLGLAILALGLLFLGIRWIYRLAKRVKRVRKVAKGVAAVAKDRRVLMSAFGLFVAILLLFPFVMPRQYVNLGLETLIYMILALGLNVIVGYAGLLVLGYAGFWAIGAYTFALLALRLDVSMWLALPAAGATAMLAGLLIGLPSLRLRGDYLAIVTLGFGEVVYYMLKTEVTITGGEMGLPNKDIRGSLQAHTSIFGSGPLVEPQHYYWPALGIVALAVFVIWRIERSRIGRALVAMREDETAARCMGINTTRLKLAAFSFAAMWAGFAGVLWCAKYDYTNPMFYNFLQSIMILAMVVLGGLGSIPGAIIGAILLYAGPALLRIYFPGFQEYRLLIFGLLMVLLMIYRPQGLFGSARLKVQLGGGEEDE